MGNWLRVTGPRKSGDFVDHMVECDELQDKIGRHNDWGDASLSRHQLRSRIASAESEVIGLKCV